MANSTALKAKKGFKIVHMNVRSLFGKIAEIGAVFKYFDVIVITETWLTDSIPDSAVSISGFNLIRKDRWSYIKKKGGGICCYIKDNLHYEKMQEDISTVNHDYQGG